LLFPSCDSTGRSRRYFAWGARWLQSSSWYDAHAAELVNPYELIDPVNLYSWLSGLLGDTPGTVLHVGAGLGRAAE